MVNIPFTLLEKAEDEETFLRYFKNIDWQYLPSNYYDHLIQLALASGAHQMARLLSARGAELYPDNSRLQKIAYILSPPTVIRMEKQ